MFLGAFLLPFLFSFIILQEDDFIIHRIVIQHEIFLSFRILYEVITVYEYMDLVNIERKI